MVKNVDPNYIICALRVEVTKEKCPSTLNVLGKKINLQTNVTRTFDVPLNRKQSIGWLVLLRLKTFFNLCAFTPKKTISTFSL